MGLEGFKRPTPSIETSVDLGAKPPERLVSEPVSGTSIDTLRLELSDSQMQAVDLFLSNEGLNRDAGEFLDASGIEALKNLITAEPNMAIASPVERVTELEERKKGFRRMAKSAIEKANEAQFDTL